ncbi:MAG TPA: hypothetical protein PKV84_05415 [Candidatus Omnitrophota bacterium]|nr:hypothetical protein [Candidatus Omnitrophota bacterium]
MKTLIVILAVFFSITTLSGCASSCKKCSGSSPAATVVPVETVTVVAPEPAAEPAEEQVPEAAKRYIK